MKRRSFRRVISALALALVAACSVGGKGGFDGDTSIDAGPPPDLAETPDATGGIQDGSGVLNNGTIDAEPSCTPDAGGPGPVRRVCLLPSDNECDGKHDLAGFAPNGSGGNGFDDDCDGLVDEGCACPAAGVTKECFLVPASQTLGGVPAGWCAENARGTVDCVKKTQEFAGTWSGQCRGAQPPFPDDVCAKGDFDCDGREENSKAHDCSCGPGSIQCPTTPLETVPYPPPSQLPLVVDAAKWFQNPAESTSAKNWKWSLVGGDCDNVLPHPTFAMYKTQDGAAPPVGAQKDTLGASGKEHGVVASEPTITSSFYPAFSLSGDYIVTGEFDLFGKHYACTQKIAVRAPGIRAEACWDTETAGVDLDLHVARVDGFASCPKKGWSETCATEDCYYGSCYGGNALSWYPPSASSACQGWGSQTSGACNNPRLDRDANGLSGVCDATVTNPNAPGGGSGTPGGGFCGPENVNVDTPADGSKYAVAVKYFGGSGVSRTHVNVYCNGERVLSTGYSPVTGIDFPKLTTAGDDTTGDMWKVTLITAQVKNGVLSCDVKPTASQNPHAALDGNSAYCVDTTSMDGANTTKYLAPGGAAPLNSDAMCFH